VVRTLMDVLPSDAIVASDAGNFFGWLSRYYRFRAPRTYVGPASGAMGYGLPAAIGAKMARPDGPVVSVSGDGGFLMTMSELETAVRYQAPVVALVLDNQRHGTIRMHQEREHPGRVVGTDLSTPDLATVAKAFGADGWSVDDNDQLEPALRKALTSEKPSVIHVRMDPGQLSVEQRVDLMK
jgi:acetolactate synthase-1/2/3 large subunit